MTREEAEKQLKEFCRNAGLGPPPKVDREDDGETYYKLTEIDTAEFTVGVEVSRFEHAGDTLVVVASVLKYLRDGVIDLSDVEIEYFDVRILVMHEDIGCAVEITEGNERLLIAEVIYGHDGDLTDEEVANIPLEPGE